MGGLRALVNRGLPYGRAHPATGGPPLRNLSPQSRRQVHNPAMNAPQLVRVDPLDVRLGLPTRVDIFDAEGQLLLARGSTVCREDSVERLQEAGFKIEAPPQGRIPRRIEPVFQRMAALADTVTQMENSLAAGQGLPSFPFKVQALAQTVIGCCDEDCNAALAQAYLDHHHAYSVLHHVLVAIGVCALSRGWSDAERISLAAAALSHDIGALALRQALGQAASLDEAQRKVVREHPDQGVHMLGALGVRDALWLQAVQDHHEHIDGSGYPRGICLGMRTAGALMAVADGFAAMVRPRPYRDRKLGTAILDDLRLHAGTWYDPSQVEAIAACFGPCHAGSIVRLANGDMAVVTHHRPDRPGQPELMLIASSGDQPMEKPCAIDVTDPDCAITAVLHPEISLRFRGMVNKSWGGT